jgi:hydroxypyruvate reductase
MNSPRHLLLSLYHSALQAVHGRTQVAHYLRLHPLQTPLALIAIGKAAPQMTIGAFEVLNSQITHALLITKTGHLVPEHFSNHAITCLETAHPVPDISSLQAGQMLLEFIASLPKPYPILFLLSGGASALVEVLAPGLTLTDLQRVNQWLLATGLDIHAMNQIRKSLSAIKGGRLASFLQGHEVLNLVISDVPGDDLQAIGSGLLTPHDQITLPRGLPDWLQTLTTKALPLATSEYFTHIIPHLIASPIIARQAAGREAAEQWNYPVYQHDDLIVGDALLAGRQIARQLRTAKPGIYLWSSETTVILPDSPGQGGRCQSLALAAAGELAGQADLYLLVAGTDGNDGPGTAAGAIIDGKTIERGQQQGLHALECLEQADAGRFLTASGDLLYTGPTGTNVMDILIGCRLD